MSNKKTPTSKLKVVALIQARMGSSRLKNKALLSISGKTIIEVIHERLKYCKEIDDIILSTADTQENDALEELAKKINLKCHRGPEEDLITRHLGALLKTKGDAFIKITADCPLVDPELVDEMVAFFRKNSSSFDLFTNSLPPTFPDGLDLDVTPLRILKMLDREIDKSSPHRDFFVAYMMSNPSRFKIYNMQNSENISHLRWTLDYPEDYSFIKEIFAKVGGRGIFGTKEVIKFIEQNPQVAEINRNRIDTVISNSIRSGAYHATIKGKEKFLILDFDRTIADLNVNWPRVKEKISNIFKPFGILVNNEMPLFDRIKDAARKSSIKEKRKSLEGKLYKRCLEEIKSEELSALKKCTLIPGAKDFINWMERQKKTYAVLSNNDSRTIERAFKKFKLKKPKIIIGSNNVNNQKPDPEGLNKILIKVKKSSNECVLVGDSWAEVELGKKTGVKTYILKVYSNKNKIGVNFLADFVESFKELKEIIST